METRERKKMFFYHGTSITAIDLILEKVDASINEKTELDFGKGFYGSKPADINYARRHALKVARDNLGRRNLKRNAVIIKCEIDESLFDNPLIIKDRDDDFIDFVFDTRSHYLNERIPYDYIEGPMADGGVSYLMSFYIKHKTERIKQFVKWCYKLPFNPYRQIVLKTQRLCDNVVIWRIENLKGEVLYEKK